MQISEVIVMGSLGIVTSAGLGALWVKAFHRWRTQRVAGELRRFFCQTYAAHEKMRAGLQTMARIVPQLEDPRQLLSRRGVELLDRHAVSMMAVERALGAGATLVWPVDDRHGWRIGRIADPFGHHWEIGRQAG